MNILITGGSGFLGSQLARHLLSLPAVPLAGGPARALEQLWLTDIELPPDDVRNEPRVRVVTGELNSLLQSGSLTLRGMHAVVHLAAAVSGDCERDLDLGLHSNLAASLALLQAARSAGEAPLFVCASSVAVFGGTADRPLPDVIQDDTLPTPQGSYGTQKFVIEQLVADFGRRGLIVARNLRLMTVAIRPGRPNGAASGFLSGMVREPLAGVRANVPVAAQTPVALASPANTLAGLMKALTAHSAQWGPRTALNLPALTTTVGEIAAALERIAGPQARALLDWEPDPRIAAIVGSWPSRIDADRAHGLGLLPDPSIDALIEQYVRNHRDAVNATLNKTP